MKFEERMHRSCNCVVIRNELLFAADFSGILHCVDASNGQANWTYDLLAQVWSTPALSDDFVLQGDEDGDLDAFAISHDPAIAMPGGNPLHSTPAGKSIYTTPTFSKNVLYVVTNDTLYAIAKPTR